MQTENILVTDCGIINYIEADYYTGGKPKAGVEVNLAKGQEIKEGDKTDLSVKPVVISTDVLDGPNGWRARGLVKNATRTVQTVVNVEGENDEPVDPLSAESLAKAKAAEDAANSTDAAGSTENTDQDDDEVDPELLKAQQDNNNGANSES